MIPAWLSLLVSIFLALSNAPVTLVTREMEKQNALTSTNARSTTAIQMRTAVTRLAPSTAFAMLATPATERTAKMSTNASKKARVRSSQRASIISAPSTVPVTRDIDFILRKSVPQMKMS